MASSTIFLHSSPPTYLSNFQICNLNKPKSTRKWNSGYSLKPIKATLVETSSFPLFQPPQVDESPSEMGLVDPDFYKIGYVRSFRAYGVEFREGPQGFGVFASKDIEPRRRARMDWDLRLACLLLLAFDQEDNFWQLYGDFLPSAEECTSLLLAMEEDLLELQDQSLELTMRKQQRRCLEFWEKNWHSAAPLKVKRLAPDAKRFMWAVSIAQTRCINLRMRVGALVQDANMLVPYADMLNHSFQPNCFFHWRFKDRMLEVMINPGTRIEKGEEMTVNYVSGQQNNMLMQRYGFSSAVNPWNALPFSDEPQIHLDTFLSIFNITGLQEEYYHNSQLAKDGDTFVDGAVIAAARTLPTWTNGDVPIIPSLERKAAKELQEQCQEILAKFPTTSKQDQQILDATVDPRRTLEAAIKYRLHQKLFIEKVIDALEIYQDKILF
ncbi:protein PLASTID TRANSCRIPTIONALLY ACTIVE 14 isoform X2 [Amaranthus tricolor]|uniref:protein PLASTID TRANSCRIPTIONALLY ACTIVE 14 isoform X2 n=1 Tax=Amaranthus tricolor TaxID=29722 RepID=UPI00258ECC60|nr:protein PLASTID TRANSCRIPTIONALLY ACTIVE 14 isoform X2 [Amaranthus tricolor]